jgi:hypothetical protein
VPELDDGVDDPLLRPELEEPELDEPVLELDEPELDEPELILAEPELWVPDDEPVDPVDPVLPEAEPGDEDVPLLEPGSVRAMAPAVTTLASPTVAVVVLIRLRPRARAAAARRTLSRFGVFMTGSLPSRSGEGL